MFHTLERDCMNQDDTEKAREQFCIIFDNFCKGCEHKPYKNYTHKSDREKELCDIDKFKSCMIFYWSNAKAKIVLNGEIYEKD